MTIEKKLGKVLVIDDSTGIRNGLYEFLTQEGYAVFLADKGEKGIELAKKEQPDVIYLDIVLNRSTNDRFKSGYIVLEELMKHEQTKNIPVIMLSGLADEEHAEEEALGSGAAEYLRKPARYLSKPFDLETKIKPLTEQYVNESRERKAQGSNK